MDTIVRKGKVVETKINNSTNFILETPHEPNEASLSFREGSIIQELFEPYLGKTITLTIEKEQGKIRKITIIEV